MLKKTLLDAAAIIALMVGSMTAFAAAPVGVGQTEFESNCVLCHGKNLRGGAYVDMLKVTPPDLTQLSKKNGGIFPFERVYEIIDGRKELAAHGTREMPIWGRVYQLKAAEYYVDVNYDPEAYVRGKILALIDYLNRMQSK